MTISRQNLTIIVVSFMSENVRNTDVLPFEQYNYEDCFFALPRTLIEGGTPRGIRPNERAIAKFLCEDAKVLNFSESWNIKNTTVQETGKLMVNEEKCHVVFPLDFSTVNVGGNAAWFECQLKTDGAFEDNWGIESKVCEYEVFREKL